MTSRFTHSRGWSLAILAASALVNAGSSFAQSGNPADCKQAILKAYHQLTSRQTASSGIQHLRFTSTTTALIPGQRATRETTVHGELYSRGTQGFFQTDDVSMWQDGRYVVTILRPSRTIILAHALPEYATDPRRLFLMRDTLIQLGKVQLCRQELRPKQPAAQHTQLAYAGVVAARLKIKTIDFWLSGSDKVQAMRINYLPGEPTQQVAVRFAVQETLATSAYLPTDARAQVLTAEGRLLPRYQGYHLVNQLATRR